MERQMQVFDCLVIGGGAAGMAAALSAAQRGAGVLLVERGPHLGGVLNQCIHNGFGLGYFREDLTGPEYAQRFIRRLNGSAVKVLTDTAVVHLRPDRSALLSGPGGLHTVRFAQCILATGCRERTIGSLPVCGTRPAGVLTAGAAQKLVNLGHYEIGERIVILGSGDVGQIMARRFTLLGKQVVAMVEIKQALGGLARNRRDCIEAFQIPVLLRATVEEVLGAERVCGVIVRHFDTGVRERIDCDTLVTALGLIPERELAAGWATDALPDWLKACGNCERIHDIVDSATRQAETIGALCAAAALSRTAKAPLTQSRR